MSNTDAIQKKILLRAPRFRVWRAISDSAEFGAWFGMTFIEPFAPGKVMDCTIVPTTVSAEVANAQEQYRGLKFEVTIERMEPERLFSYRWHPGAAEPGKDYSNEPTTLVEFVIEEVPEGIMLTVTESGFDKIPLERRAQAFTQNEQGWGMVIHLIEAYLAQKP
jgi:uncharacterized protein YndB with AHSA1/START domain